MGGGGLLIVDIKIVEANLVARGCERYEELDSATEMGFLAPGDKTPFVIPCPVRDGAYTQVQLELLERVLARFEIELLPLDPNI